jgi:hypothetical protein
MPSKLAFAVTTLTAALALGLAFPPRARADDDHEPRDAGVPPPRSLEPPGDEEVAPGAERRDEPAPAAPPPAPEVPGEELVEELTYMQHPGLPPAASKIFFSKHRYTISGFAEIAYIHHFGETNRSSGDIELYDTNLYRLTLYGAYRPADWLVLYAEAFAELYQDGFREAHYEVLPEVFADFLLTNPSPEARKTGPHIGPLNLRTGFIQVPIGFINQNDEPIMFYSVNRPEVERLIIPSQWVELGVEAYGKLSRRVEWLLHAFQGVDGEELIGASWIRRGRNPGYELRSPALAAQINVMPVDHLDLSVSGVAMESGGGHRVVLDGRQAETVRANTGIAAGYARYEVANWTFMALGTIGFMSDTGALYELTRNGERGPQVLGERAYGYYFEVGCDILPYFRRAPAIPRHTLLYRSDELRLPLFARYERLDTHAAIDPRLASRLGSDQPIFRSDLDVLTLGLNFRPRRNLVLKANYGIRRNRAQDPRLAREGNLLELGVGVIF